MIILDKNLCCGCSACAQRCPQQCIVMKEDEDGFTYPETDARNCIGCGLCEDVCPCLNTNAKKEPLSVIAAINSDSSVRFQSSSGGIFSMLAESVLGEGGVVFGARFNEKWDVVVDYTESLDGLVAFRGSKYVQAFVGDCFQRAESFLKSGRKVLFSGTPCQVSGLRLFLHNEYDNLLTVAVACHSVPSPIVWREYLKGLNFRDISDIQFRDKRISWEQYGLKIVYDGHKEFFQHHRENPFMQLFLHGIITRLSCFNCSAKDGKSGADIILGDCWGISQMHPDYPNDHQGISFVLCQTDKGSQAIEKAGVKGLSLQYEKVISHNGGLVNRAILPNARSAFWPLFRLESNKKRVLYRFAKPFFPSYRKRISSIIKRVFKK